MIVLLRPCFFLSPFHIKPLAHQLSIWAGVWRFLAPSHLCATPVHENKFGNEPITITYTILKKKLYPLLVLHLELRF